MDCWAVVCRRKFNFNARLGTVSPLWKSRKRLPGRRCPFINFDQIFTVHHMACLTSHSHFSRPGFEQFGAIFVPFGWTRAMSYSAGPCWCLWDLATWENWLHWVLTYDMLLGSTFHFNNTSYPQLQWMNHCHKYMHAHTQAFHTFTVQCYVLCAYPFNLKRTKGNVPSSCTQTLQLYPRLHVETKIPFQHPAVWDLLENLFGRTLE